MRTTKRDSATVAEAGRVSVEGFTIGANHSLVVRSNLEPVLVLCYLSTYVGGQILFPQD
jgi:hypothetical protein